MFCRSVLICCLVYFGWMNNVASFAIENAPSRHEPVYPWMTKFYSKPKSTKKLIYNRRYISNERPKNELNNIRQYDSLSVFPRVTISPDAELLLPPSSKYYDAVLRSLVRLNVAQPMVSARTYPHDYASVSSSPSSPYTASYDTSYSQQASSDDPSASYGPSSSTYSSYDTSNYAQAPETYTSEHPGYDDDYSSYYGFPSYDPSTTFAQFHPGYVSSGTPHGTLSEQSPAAASHFHTGYGSSPSSSSQTSSQTSDLAPLTNETTSRSFGNYNPSSYVLFN